MIRIMGDIINLSDENKKALHPEALRCFNDCIAELEKDLQQTLKNLNRDDLAALSSNDENPFREIGKVLSRYVDIEGRAEIYAEVKTALKRPILMLRVVILNVSVLKLMRDIIEPIAGLIGFKHEDIKRLPQRALERFNDDWKEIREEVPQLYGLTVNEIKGDITTYLEPADKERLLKCQEAVLKFWQECVNSNDYSPLYTSYWHDIYEFKALMKEVYHQKEVKLEEEAKKEEYKRKFSIAYETVNPPLDDAKHYLDWPREKDNFLEAARGAAAAYLEKGANYRSDFRYLHYAWYLKKINNGKKEEQILNDAKAQATAFGTNLEQGLKEVEKLLSTRKKDPKVFFSNWCSNNGEKRYQEELFTDILASDNFRDRNWTQDYIQPAEDSLRQSIPGEFQNFILVKPTVVFFLLPSADYGYYGVPCLDFYFDVFAVVTITVLAQAWHKVFNEYKFNFLRDLREPKLLGLYHIIITPKQPTFWQSIPLTILYALLAGKFKASDTTIIHRLKEETIYKVKKFEDDICEIPISFEQCCHSWGSIDKMKQLGIINERTAEMLEFPQPIRNNHKQGKSKKAKALEYFSQGKRPSDPEVKSLGIKPTTAYRYHQEWKRVIAVGNNRT